MVSSSTLKQEAPKCLIFLLFLFIVSCAQHEGAIKTTFPRKSNWKVSGFIFNIDNTLVFAEYYGKWIIDHDPILHLPQNSKGAFGFHSGRVAVEEFGVLTMYQLKDGEWVVFPGAEFKIPQEVDSVFGFSMGMIGLKKGQKVYFYAFNQKNEWERERHMDCRIQERFDEVFSFGLDSIAVRFGNTIDIWEYKDGWSKREMSAFMLPVGWKQVFGFHMAGLAIVMDDKIIFYMAVGKEWKEVPEAQFEFAKFLNQDPSGS